MATSDSSAGEDKARFTFASWCTRCGHQFRTKQHAHRHFALCPQPHELRYGSCGIHYGWKAFVRHVNVKGVGRRRQLCHFPPLPPEPHYNISCCRPQPLLPPSRPAAMALASPLPPAAVAASPLSCASVSMRSPDGIAEPSASALMQPASAKNFTFSAPSSTAAVAPWPLSLSPISDSDLQAVLEKDYSDLARSDLYPPPILSTTTAATPASDLASSSLHSLETTSSATLPVQPLYTAQSPSAAYLVDQLPPLPPAAALPPIYKLYIDAVCVVGLRCHHRFCAAY